VEPKTGTGRASFATSWPVPVAGGVGPLAVSTGRAVQVAQLATGEVMPRVLALGGNAIQQSSDFPPAEGADADGGGRIGSWQAGFVDANNVDAFPDTRWAAAVLEYGVGAVQQRAVFDWRAGFYQLPPCTFVRVGVLPWGTGWGLVTGNAIADLNACAFAASITTGECQARAPLCSGTVLLGGTMLSARTFRVPAKTAAVEARLISGAGGTLIASEDGGGTPRLKRNLASLADYPSWGPMQWSSANGPSLRLEVDVLAWAGLQFFLSL
jgi:hypothetical protein